MEECGRRLLVLPARLEHEGADTEQVGYVGRAIRALASLVRVEGCGVEERVLEKRGGIAQRGTSLNAD